MIENQESFIIEDVFSDFSNFTQCLLSDDCDGSEYYDTKQILPDYFFTIIIFVYSIIFVGGLVGNTLVIYVVSRFPGLHTVTNTYILNLAIADECFLLGLPFLITTMIFKQWPFGSTMCTLYLITTTVNQITSSLFLMVLSADRYIAVCHPISAPSLRTPLICRVVTVSTWVLSMVMMIPVFMFSTTVTNPNTAEDSCQIVWPVSTAFYNSQSVFTIYSFIFGFAGPCLLILLFYGLVMVQLWCCGPSSLVRIRSPSQLRLQRKVTRLILTVITVYILCWLPHWSMQIILIFAPPGMVDNSTILLLVLVASCLQYSNSAINPILYAFLSDHFKKSFREACFCYSRGSGARGYSTYRHRDITFTTRRTRRGPMFTAILQDDTSARPGGDGSSHVSNVTHVTSVSRTRDSPRHVAMNVVSGHLAPPSVR